MTYLKLCAATLAVVFCVSPAVAYEVVDSNNGFAGPAFAQSDPDESVGPAVLNSDNFSDAHINSHVDNEKQFAGYSYSGFTFEDQIDGQGELKQVSEKLQDTKVESATNPGSAAR